MADLAFTFHFQPSELKRLSWPEIMDWHEQIERINKQLAKK